MEDQPALPKLESFTNVDQLTASLVEMSLTYGVRIFGALAVLLVAWVAAGWLAKLSRDALNRAGTDKTVTSFLTTLVRWGSRVVGVILCLGVFGIEATSLAAILGGAGVAIGIALKGNLSNLASGLLLLAFRPFKTHDWIEVEGDEGRVARLGLLQTELDTFDNARCWIPNSLLIEAGLTNYDHHEFRRLDVPVGVSYDADLRSVSEVLRSVVEELTDTEAGEEPVVRAEEFGDSSINFKVGIWVPSKAYKARRHDLVLAMKDALDEAGFEIPYPQRDLHLVESVAMPIRQPAAAK